MQFTRKTEIRHVPPMVKAKIGLILSHPRSWKKLMGTIPKVLPDSEQLGDSEPKYSSNDIQLIEDASFQSRINAAEILFEEWGTSGRIRPTLSHLLQLLVKAELFRAAEHVARLLNEKPPERPSQGPAAKVNISLSSALVDETIETNGNSVYQNSSTLLANINKVEIDKVLPEMVRKVDIIPSKTLDPSAKLVNKESMKISSDEDSDESKDYTTESQISDQSIPNESPNSFADIPNSSIFDGSQMIPDIPELHQHIQLIDNNVTISNGLIASSNSSQVCGSQIIPDISELHQSHRQIANDDATDKELMASSSLHYNGSQMIPNFTELRQPNQRIDNSTVNNEVMTSVTSQSEYTPLIPILSELYLTTDRSADELLNMPNLSSLNKK